MVKALDCRSGEDSTCRFDSLHGRFFFLYLLMMMMVERRAAAQASAKHERLNEYKVRSPRERSDRECKCKVHSLREQSDRVDVPE